MNIWTMCIKPNCVPHVYAAFDWCKKNDCVGIGWPLDPSPQTPAEAFSAYRKTWPKRRLGAFGDFVETMKEGDFVFLQRGARYYCCKISSGWRAKERLPSDSTNLGHIRDAMWAEVPIDLVPGSIRRGFIRVPTCRRVMADEFMAKYVTSLYDDYAGSRELPPDAGLDVQRLNSRLAEIGGEARLFDLADWDETEDLACTFLQSQGWRLQKSFASRSQPKIECMFLKAGGNTSSIALIQVKSGNERIDVSSFGELARRYTSVYLFSTASDPYSNIPDTMPKEIELLERSKIFDYFKRNPLELPRSLQRKLNSQI